MDVELARTIGALVSLGLGLFIMGLLVCRVYLNAPKLTAVVGRASIRAVDACTFDCQIDLDVSAKGGDLYLNTLAIQHPAGIFDSERGVDKHSIGRLCEYLGYSVLDEDETGFSTKLRALIDRASDVHGLKFCNVESKRMSIVDRISVIQSADGGLNWPTEGWALIFKTSAGIARIPFVFSVHESNDVNAFCRNYSPSGAMVWSC